MAKVIYFFVLILSLLIGCSDGTPRIDASSDYSLKSSIENVRQSLNAEERSKFDEALQTVVFSQINFQQLLLEGKNGDLGAIESNAKNFLDGKTGSELIAEADRIIKERKEREKVQAIAEIKELEEKKTASEKARTELTKFKILRSRFYKRDREFIGKEPIVELAVMNGTNYPISRAYFKGTLASPNRSIPWLQEDFNYKISGGLEPGEEAAWKLAPNMFSDWGTVDSPPDAILTVEVEQLDGPEGKPLFTTRNFTEEDAERLEKLKNEYSKN